MVDHINRDRLDNRRCNLRLCTNAENQRNTGLWRTSTTGIKGICRYRGRWRAQFTHLTKRYWAGDHDTIEAAVAAYHCLRAQIIRGP